jgi:hypothetical protein
VRKRAARIARLAQAPLRQAAFRTSSNAETCRISPTQGETLMFKPLQCARIVACALVMAAGSAAAAFPDKPIRMVVISAPGGTTTSCHACLRKRWAKAWASR